MPARILMAVFVVLLLIAIIALTVWQGAEQAREGSSRTTVNDSGRESAASRASVRSRAEDGRRVAALRTAIQNTANAKRRDAERSETAEDNMIRRLGYLDTVLAEETKDANYARKISDEILKSLRENGVESTNLDAVVCGETLCRVDFRHDHDEGHEYLLESKVLEEGSWGHEGAGREYRNGGKQFTSLFFGKRGQKLPIIPDGVRQRR